MYEIEIVQEIDSGHKLSLPYVSKCNGWHGHRWKVVATLRSKHLNSDGVVLDFIYVKEVIKRFDHKFFLCIPGMFTEGEGFEYAQMKPHRIITFASSGEIRGLPFEKDPEPTIDANGIIFTNFQPTAENLARLFFEEIESSLCFGTNVSHKIEVVKIELWETPSGKIVYRRGEE